MTGSFAKLAVVSALARLVTYTGVPAATLRLRSPRFAGDGEATRPSSRRSARSFRPIAIAVSLGDCWLGATRAQMLGGFAALAGGAVLFWINGQVRSER